MDGIHPLTLDAEHRFYVVPAADRPGWWQIQLVSYQFAFRDARLGELLAYHWHPIGRSHIIHPHVHLGPALAIPTSPAANAHLPTGIITLPDVLRLAITDMGVEPRRDDWERVLAEAQSAK